MIKWGSNTIFLPHFIVVKRRWSNLKEKLVIALKGQRLCRRIAVYVLGYFITALGVAFSIHANLGVAPAASLPYIISLVFGQELPGTTVTIVFTCYILIQIAILRKRFKWINVTQIIPSILFGYFVDISIRFLAIVRVPDFRFLAYGGVDFHVFTYLAQLGLLLASIIAVALGLIMVFDANFVNLPVESLAKVITQVLPNHKHFSKFHVNKMMCDSVAVSLAILLSLLFLGGIVGIREGTVLSAIFIGKAMPYIRIVAEPAMRKVGIYKE